MKHDKLPDKGNRHKKNAFGLISVILWALFLTVLFRSCWSSYENAGTVVVPYTTFCQWVEEDKIATVDMQSSQYVFTLKEGVTVELPEDSQNQSSTQDLLNALVPQPQESVEVKYITVPLAGVQDDSLLQLLKDHGVEASTQPVDSSTYLLNLFLAYVMPILVMVGLFLSCSGA